MAPEECNLPCQLEIDQSAPLTVGEFADVLVQKGWILDNPNRTYYASYAPDIFSMVMESQTSIELDANTQPVYGNELSLYIGYVGGATDPAHDEVALEEIEQIKVTSNMSIFNSWLVYGFPESGQVLPIITSADLEGPRPCENVSHYIANYDGGRMMIRAVIHWPVIPNLLTTPVEFIYPIAEKLNQVEWSDQLYKMNHNPCMPN